MLSKASTAILSFGLLGSTCQALSLTCLEYPFPHNPRISIEVDCSPLQTQPQAQKAAVALSSSSTRFFSSATRSSSSTTTLGLVSEASTIPSDSGLRSPVLAILQEAVLPAPVPNQNSENFFRFDVTCPANFGTATCADANATLYLAGQLISNVLALTSPIVVNATLTSFCGTLGICDEGGSITSLAAASPARNIPLLDEDGIVRYYPQAVVKQMASYFPMQPQLGQYDINLNMNAQASFYYSGRAPGRPAPPAIKSSQTDFLFVVMHELMHGLGFTSSYEDYFHPTTPSTVTPNVRIFVTNDAAGQQGIAFAGFAEYAFDRFVAVDGNLLTGTVVAQMNERLFSETSGRVFGDEASLATFFTNTSAASGIAKQLGKSLTTRHTTTLSLAATALLNTTTLFNSSSNNSSSKGKAGTALVLETGIVPFSAGSSVSHVSADLYDKTLDFLMRFEVVKGATVQSYITAAVQAAQSQAQTQAAQVAMDATVYGALGPGLRSVLAGLGYRVRGGVQGLKAIQNPAAAAAAATAVVGSTGMMPIDPAATNTVRVVTAGATRQSVTCMMVALGFVAVLAAA